MGVNHWSGSSVLLYEQLISTNYLKTKYVLNVSFLGQLLGLQYYISLFIAVPCHSNAGEATSAFCRSAVTSAGQVCKRRTLLQRDHLVCGNMWGHLQANKTHQSSF